ncbi:homeobox domain protein [Ceratobasidium sp. AG-Ba]|nr:homeobox domain protein [Ceratobasidium sp. AG-Ba]QRW07391.1 homeobox domain protein [Ceratobasidium sp. AG-Ba]
MPKKSKKSRAASKREARKAQALASSFEPNELEQDPYRHQYRPCNPECQPYWDEFYQNPYPNDQECEQIARRLDSTFSTIKKWFEMARRYTHTPDKGPGSNTDMVDRTGLTGRDAECAVKKYKSHRRVTKVLDV